MSKFHSLTFKPFPLFEDGHLQTVAAALLPFPRHLPSTKRFVYLSDGDCITYEVSTPEKWKSIDPTVVMIHGLCGSHRSPYVVRFAKKLSKHGIRTIRINLRGCGSGRRRSKKMYHVDSSDDVWRGLKKIKNEMPDSSLILVGFSLGGNVALKMAGEWANEARHLIDKLIAINPPIDLIASAHRLSKSKIYEKYFMFYLRYDMIDIHNHFADLPPIAISPKMSLFEFDEFYIAPQSGYLTAREYYYASSAGRVIPEIKVNSHILFARDDPIVDYSAMKHIKIPNNVQIFITDKGGHLGYLGMPGKSKHFHWIDGMLLNWIFPSMVLIICLGLSWK